MASSSGGGGRLKSASEDLFSTLSGRAMSAVGDKLTGLTDKLEDVASGSPSAKAAIGSAKSSAKGEGPVKGALKGAASAVKDSVKDKVPGLGGGSGGSSDGSGKATKATNIIEQIDVGVPVRVAYNQWTEFGGFPTFMKKVENVDAEEDNKIEWKAQIVWSHRSWEATILEQTPDRRIVWRSEGEKGHVDGAVTFHEIGPDLTRILVVLEYYPQGLFERTGNLWRAQGRRVRVELKHFRRHVMTRTILDPDEVEGWRGTIEDGEVVTTHEEALEQEEDEQFEEDGESGDYEDQYEDEPEDGAEEEAGDEPEDEYDEDEEAEEYEESGDEPEDQPEDEYEPEDADGSEEGEEYADEDAEGEPEDEYEDEEADAEEYEEEPEAEEEAEPDDEYEDAEDVGADDEPEDDEVEDEVEEQDEEEATRPRSRRRRAS